LSFDHANALAGRMQSRKPCQPEDVTVFRKQKSKFDAQNVTNLRFIEITNIFEF
jgi:hypothetical protein